LAPTGSPSTTRKVSVSSPIRADKGHKGDSRGAPVESCIDPTLVFKMRAVENLGPGASTLQ
jgi:hypothetical protein